MYHKKDLEKMEKELCGYMEEAGLLKRLCWWNYMDYKSWHTGQKSRDVLGLTIGAKRKFGKKKAHFKHDEFAGVEIDRAKKEFKITYSSSAEMIERTRDRDREKTNRKMWNLASILEENGYSLVPTA